MSEEVKEKKLPEVNRNFSVISSIILGDKIRTWITDSKISLEVISMATGIEINRLKKILSGTEPTLTEIDLMAQLQGLDARDLIPSIDYEDKKVIEQLINFEFSIYQIVYFIKEHLISDFGRLFKYIRNQKDSIEDLKEKNKALSDENDRLVEKSSKDDETIRMFKLYLEELERYAAQSTLEEIIKEIGRIRELLSKQKTKEVDLTIG